MEIKKERTCFKIIGQWNISSTKTKSGALRQMGVIHEKWGKDGIALEKYRESLECLLEGIWMVKKKKRRRRARRN